jgi:hypothetical protein
LAQQTRSTAKDKDGVAVMRLQAAGTSGIAYVRVDAQLETHEGVDFNFWIVHEETGEQSPSRTIR